MNLCAGTLPCGHRAVRGRPGKSGTCDCCGPGIQEYLGHIIQVCPRTWGPLIKRHNLIVEKIKRKLVANRWMVWVKPQIKTPSSEQYKFIKPDLVLWNGQLAWVLDLAIEGDQFDPDTGHDFKCRKYSNVPEISA